MRITVFGSTGDTGRLVVERLLELGHDVIAFARDSAKLAVTHANLHEITGDAFDADAVDEAVAGSDVVISLLGTRLDQMVDKIRTKGTTNVIAAMKRHGVQRIVVVSGAGGHGSASQMGRFTWWLYRKKVGEERFAEVDRLEDLLAESDLDFTVIRPPRLTDDKTKSPPTVEPKPEVQLSSLLTRSDLADVLVAQAIAEGTHEPFLTALSNRR